MKIAIILSRCHKYGSSRYVLDTVNYFTKKGHEVHIFAHTCDPIENKKVFVHKLPRLNLGFVSREISLSVIQSILLKFYSFNVTISQPTRYFSPDVAEVQFVFKQWINYQERHGIKWGLAGLLLKMMESYNLKKVKKIIVLSNSVKNELVKNYGIDEGKIHVVYSGVNLKEFTPKNRKKYFNEIREKFNIPKTSYLLLFVGNPYDRKGVEYIIRALSLLKSKNIKLFISGKDDPKPYKELCNKLGVQNMVIFNPILVSDVYKYFSAADAFIFPSIYEPFGLVILEAMASGLPVITNRKAGAAEIIKDGKEGLLLDNPKNHEEIAQKIKYLIENKKVRRQISIAARKKAEKYSWKKVAEERLKVLEQAALIKKRG